MPLKKYEIETSYDANGQIIVRVGNPEGDLAKDNPEYHHGHPSGTQPEEGGDHITVIVKELNPQTNIGDLVFTGIEMYQDSNSEYFEVVSVITKEQSGAEKERERRKTAVKVESGG